MADNIILMAFDGDSNQYESIHELANCQNISAMKIQAMVRGVLTRKRELNNLIKQKLNFPESWNIPIENNSEISQRQKSNRFYVTSDKLSELRMEMKTLQSFIQQNVLTPEDMKYYKSRTIIPQVFDEHPYVSLSDGRQINYYSHVNSILNSEIEVGKNAQLQQLIAIKNQLIAQNHVEDTKRKSITHHMNESQDPLITNAIDSTTTTTTNDMMVSYTKNKKGKKSKKDNEASSSMKMNSTKISSSRPSSSSPYNMGMAIDTTTTTTNTTTNNNNNTQDASDMRTSLEKLLVKEHLPIHMFNTVLWPLQNASSSSRSTCNHLDTQSSNSSNTNAIYDPNITYLSPTLNGTIATTTTTSSNVNDNNSSSSGSSSDNSICMSCHKKFSMIYCSMCHRSFCFPCSERIHSQPTHKFHHTELLFTTNTATASSSSSSSSVSLSATRPHHTVNSNRMTTVTNTNTGAIAVKNSNAIEDSKSLISHIRDANIISQDLKSMLSGYADETQAKKIQEDRKLAREYEKQEKYKQKLAEEAQKQDISRHHAVTIISLIYRRIKAKRIVTQIRQQRQYEYALSERKRIEQAVIKIQARYRCPVGGLVQTKRQRRKNSMNKPMDTTVKTAFIPPFMKSTRSSMRSSTRTYTEEEDNILTQRIDYDITQRRILERQKWIYDMNEKYIMLHQMIEKNINYWTTLYYSYQTQEKHLNTFLESCMKDHEVEMIATAKQKTLVSDQEYRNMEKGLRRLMLRVEALKNRIEMIYKSNWWISQILRSLYRRKSIIEERYKDSCARLEWLAIEDAIVSRIEYHVRERLSYVSSNTKADNSTKSSESETKSIETVWLSSHLEHIVSWKCASDGQQETILKEEVSHLISDDKMTRELDLLLEELLKSYRANSQYFGERTYLEQQTMRNQSALNSADISKQLLLLKQKQIMLEDGLITSIQTQLHTLLSEEDTTHMNTYGFPTDNPDLSIDQFHTIKAVLFDEYKHSSTLTTTATVVSSSKATGTSTANDTSTTATTTTTTTTTTTNPHLLAHHYDFKDFITVLMVQPWLEEQAIHDIRLEEEYTSVELKKGQLQEEITELHQRMTTMEESIENNQEKILLLNEEIEIRKNEEIAPSETELLLEVSESKGRKMLMMAKLTNELVTKSSELKLLQEKLENLVTKEHQLQDQVTIYSDRMKIIMETLNAHKLDITEQSKLFFLTEKNRSHVVQSQVNSLIQLIEQKLVHLQHDLMICEKVVKESNQDIDQYLQTNTTLSIEDYKAFNLPPYNYHTQLLLFNALATINPRIDPTSTQYLNEYFQHRICMLQMNIRYYNALFQLYTYESAICGPAGLESKLGTYEYTVQLYLDSISQQHRQRALQQELDSRYKRLNTVRTIRLAQLIEEENKLKEEGATQNALKEAAEKEAKLRKERRPTATKQVLRGTKLLVRTAKDTLADIRTNTSTMMSEEELRMADKIRGNKNYLDNNISGIRDIKFTVGREEENYVTQQNDVLSKRGLPIYVRSEKSIGAGIYIWTQQTTNVTDFITEILYSHRNKKHEKHISDQEMKSKKYSSVQHKLMDLQLWIKRDLSQEYGYTNLRIAYSEEDEMRMMVDGLEKIHEDSLTHYSLPEGSLWAKRINKLEGQEPVVNSNSLIAQLHQVNHMIEQSPNDPILKELKTRIQTRLKQALDKEKENIVNDPLQAAVDLMALTPIEMEKWLLIFKKFDRSKRGGVSYEDIFTLINEFPNDYFMDIFRSMDAVNPDTGLIDSGDFIRSVSTYCFFGKDEILRSLFTYADKTHRSTITHEEFVGLLNTLNPYDKQRAKRVLRELDLVKDNKMTYDEFVRINNQFPTILYPAFKFQHSLRSKTMGEDWWVSKLLKYQQVRQKVSTIDEKMSKLADIELDRLNEDRERMKRMKQREKKIKESNSSVQKVLLQARQYVDANL